MSSSVSAILFPPPGAEEIVSPPRPARATDDVMKLKVPLPVTVTLIAAAIGIAAAMWRIETNMSNINLIIQYERQLDVERQKQLDLRFQALDAKIETAGLRNASMNLATQLQNATKK